MLLKRRQRILGKNVKLKLEIYLLRYNRTSDGCCYKLVAITGY